MGHVHLCGEPRGRSSDPGVEATEWEPLLNGILEQRSTLELVTFLVPDGFEVGGQAQFLNSLEQSINSHGIDVLRVPA